MLCILVPVSQTVYKQRVYTGMEEPFTTQALLDSWRRLLCGVWLYFAKVLEHATLITSFASWKLAPHKTCCTGYNNVGHDFILPFTLDISPTTPRLFEERCRRATERVEQSYLLLFMATTYSLKRTIVFLGLYKLKHCGSMIVSCFFLLNQQSCLIIFLTKSP